MAEQTQVPDPGSGEAPFSKVTPNIQSENLLSKDAAQLPSAGSGEVPAPAVQIKPESEKPPPVDQIQINSETAVIQSEQPKLANAEVKTAEDLPKDVSSSESNISKVEDESSLQISGQDWKQKEQELLRKIEELEKVTKDTSKDGLMMELKVREEQIDLLKTRVHNLETKLEAAFSKPAGKNHEMIENIKQQHEELLSKARGMIFDKTKVVKNQELQIEALTSQVQSLKDVNVITKDLLEIRNSEVKAMEERLQVMESRFKAEKERYDLVLRRAQTSTNINDDLRKEYETQLKIFKELREKYEQRVQALVAENNRLKESAGGSG